MLRWHDFAVLVRYEIPTAFLQSQYQQELLLFWLQLQIIPLRLSLRLRIFGEAVWSCCRLQANLRSKATCFRVSTKSQEKLNLHWVKIFLKGSFVLILTLIFFHPGCASGGGCHFLWWSFCRNCLKVEKDHVKNQ